MTEVIKVDPADVDATVIARAAKVIQAGNLVAFPTETIYGLGADTFNVKAVKKIFAAKGRPSDNPLIVHVAALEDVLQVAAVIPDVAQTLMKKFWPGPLTLVLQKKAMIPDEVTAGLQTVAVRMPDHAVILELIKAAGVPIAAPSANKAGKPSPTSAQHVLEDLKGKVDMILDAGPAHIGLESTVLDVTQDVPVLLRPGGVTFEMLQETVGKVIIHTKDVKEVPPAPGMKYVHYSPKAKVILVEGTKEKVSSKMQELIEEHKGKKIGVLTMLEEACYDVDVLLFAGKELDLIARNLFNLLREFDQQKVDVIFVASIEEQHLGLAIMNRLRKAASEVVKA